MEKEIAWRRPPRSPRRPPRVGCCTSPLEPPRLASAWLTSEIAGSRRSDACIQREQTSLRGGAREVGGEPAGEDGCGLRPVVVASRNDGAQERKATAEPGGERASGKHVLDRCRARASGCVREEH